MKIEWDRAEFRVKKNREHMQLNEIELEWMGSIKINRNRQFSEKVNNILLFFLIQLNFSDNQNVKGNIIFT